MTDAVPELWEQISRDFNRSASTDVWIRSFLRRVKDGTATSEEASIYAGRLGTHAGSALTRALKKESLPDGKLYWNIADRTIRPLLTEVHRRVNDAAAAVLAAENKKNGIGLKPMRGPWPENRVKDLIDKIVEVYAEEEADGQ